MSRPDRLENRGRRRKCDSVIVKSWMSRDNAGHDKQGRGDSGTRRGQRHAAEIESGEGAACEQAGVRWWSKWCAHAQPLGAKKIIAVVGHQAEKVAAVVEPFGVTRRCCSNRKTARATQCWWPSAPSETRSTVVVLPGDAPLVRTETLRALINKHKKGNAAATILTAVLADPSGYGRILRKSGDTVAAIIEESQLTPEQREINEINSSIYCFTTAKLWPALAQVKPNNKHREIYLTDAIAMLNAKGETVLAEILADARGRPSDATRERTWRAWTDVSRMEARRADEQRRDHSIAGNGVDRSRSDCREKTR